MLIKNTLIKIIKSFGRYLSLLIIILVGVGFFVGIQSSAPDIAATLSQYNGSHKLMNFQIVSTMGLTDDDVNAIRSIKNVDTVTPSDSLDVLESGKAVRVQAIESSVNTVKLVGGRMPKTDTECVADVKNYKIGDKIHISSDESDKLKNIDFRVVGTIESPLFIAHDYGKTTVGDGKLYSFFFVNRDNFTLDAYTQINITALGAGNGAAFSKEYDSLTAQIKSELVKLKPDRENARYQEIYTKADKKITDSDQTLNTEKAKGEAQLANAKATLDANAVKLQDAKNTLAKNESDLNQKAASQEADFQTAKAQIASGWDQINATLQSNNLTQEELPSKISSLSAAIAGMKAQQSTLPASSPEYAALTAQISQYSAMYDGLSKLQASIDTLHTQEDQLNQGITTFHTQIASAQQQIASGKNELAQNEKKLDDGYREYNENLATFNAKMTDAQVKIADAKTKLSQIDKPKWTIFDRESAVAGYSDLKAGTETITSVARVFPLFFILIVLLITSNSMARMIAEERSELGTLSSLGFQDTSMTAMYLLYVLSATVFGAVIGFFVGCTIIPKIIFACFPYLLPPLVIQYNIPSFLLILAVAAALMTAVTVFFCHAELKQKPATLMRPIPPKSGKTILLERIGIIWNHLSFTWKVTLRNIFRYKQRVFMTIVGVAGCTALLLAGFGVQDSISGVAQKQYGQIFRYHDLIVLKNETDMISGDLEKLLAKEQIQSPALIRQSAFTCESRGKSLDAYLIVPENNQTLDPYFNLISTRTRARISLNDNSVVISQKIAELYKIGKGDKLQVRDADHQPYSLTVTDVAENYIQNYIYMSKDGYSKVFGKPASYNMIVSDHTGNEKTLAKHLLASNTIVNVNFQDEILKQAVEENKSLNGVVLLIVCIASLLAVIVLYNLTSINISERKREIATLKVLGFTDSETNQYIYREAMILSLISTGVGLLLGVLMHRFVMGAIERETVVYFKTIQPLSFVWAFLITMVSSGIMQIVTYFKLQKIDMIESLKSVE